MSDNAIPMSGVSVELLFGDGHFWEGFNFGFLPARLGRQIGFVEELGEEYEVREVHGHWELDVDLGDVARFGRRGGEVVVRPHVDRAADYHLRQLQASDDHGEEPRRVLAHAHQGVVRVHHAGIEHDRIEYLNTT